MKRPLSEAPKEPVHGSLPPFPSYSQYTYDQILGAFTQGPDRLRAAIAGLSEEELRIRARGPRQWSAHEIVLHTTDSEIQGTYRFRKVWAQSGCELPSYDQDAWARELDYLGSCTAEDRENALELLAALRRAATPLLMRATADYWNRWGTHLAYGKITLRNVLELYADHTERHIAQILQIRDILGKPTNLPLLLPDRLDLNSVHSPAITPTRP
ncbi:MAG: DUF664 domain-containing protein [Gemmatimonadales bacterium]|nr:DUF664 domain-containing protein [Gemmatimonadales bacterium]